MMSLTIYFVITHYDVIPSIQDEWLKCVTPGVSTSIRPTNCISIEFEIRPKFAVLWFKMYSTDHNEILHTSRQCNCPDMYKISLWSVEHILN